MTITLEVVAIIISLLAALITIIGFFASLKFYRDGMEYQQNANDVLALIREKTVSIQNHVTGIFDKTLEAAIGSGNKVTGSMNDLKKDIDEIRNSISQVSQSELNEIGEHKKEKLISSIEQKINELNDKIDKTRNYAEDFFEESINLNELEKEILVRIYKNGGQIKSMVLFTDLKSSNTYDERSVQNLLQTIHKMTDAGLLNSSQQSGSSWNIIQLSKSGEILAERYLQKEQNP